MMRHRHLAMVALWLALAALPSCQSADSRPTVEQIISEGARQVVGDELLALHTDVTHYGTFARSGNPWTEYHHADGGVAYRERSRPESGTWFPMPGEQVCYTYPWNADGPPYCYRYFVKDGRYFIVDANGDHIDIVSGYIDAVRPGDPEGLAR